MLKNISLLALAILFSVTVNAQQYLNQVIVLNEGHYNYTLQQIEQPVTVGLYNPLTNVYTCFDTIEGARFATDVQVDDATIYVAADNNLLKYDLNTHALISTQAIAGIRKLALWNNKILLTRGVYLTSFNSYFQVYNKSDLSFVYELDTLSGPQFSSDGIVVKDNIAYIAINNGLVWGGAVGIVGRVDLNTQNYLSEIPLGADGINPENIMVSNNKIYTLNNKDYTSASISSVDIASTGVVTTNLNNAGGCQGSVLLTTKVIYQTYNEKFLGRFDVNAQAISDSLFINKTVYALGSDVLNNKIYASETDFTSFGLVLIYSSNGNLLNAFVAGVTPGKFAFDYQGAVGVNEINTSSQLLVFPNPAFNELTIAATNTIGNCTVTLTSIDGKILYSENVSRKNFVQHIDISEFAYGTYLLAVKSDKNIETRKIVKF